MKTPPCYIVAFLCINSLIFSYIYDIRAEEAVSGKIPSDFTGSSEEPLTHVLGWAEQIKEPFSKAEALIKIAAAYVELGEEKKAKYILHKALNIATDTEDKFSKAILFSELIDKYVSLNESEKAQEIAKNIEFPDTQSEALLRITEGYMQQNQYEKSRKLIENINEPFAKALAISRLLNKFKESQLYVEVLKMQKIIEKSSPQVKEFTLLILTAEDYKIKNRPIYYFLASRFPFQKAKALIVMGKKYISLKLYEPVKLLLEQAVLLSADIKEEAVKSEILSQIAGSYAQIGEYKTASQIAYTIKIPFCRSKALTQIAIGYAQRGEFENALKTTEDIDSEYLKEEALGQVIIQYIKDGKEEEAMRIVSLSAPLSAKASLYARLADYYIENKELNKAIEISKIIEDPYMKFKVLLAIAKNIERGRSSSFSLIK